MGKNYPFMNRYTRILRPTLIPVLLAAFSLTAFSQDTRSFKEIVRLPATPVKDQGHTGTCWSFATLSFLESELLRMDQGEHDLSEMFVVRNSYIDRAELYVRFHGHLNFGPGAQAWDVIQVMQDEGLVPQDAYPGQQRYEGMHRHGEMDAVLKGYMQKVTDNPDGTLSSSWQEGFRGILDAYLGDTPRRFSYEGGSYDPTSFVRDLGLEPSDYMPATSFMNHDYFSWYVFESPDNWSMEQIYNVPLDELVRIVKHSLEEGYTVAWAADVSNPGFDSRRGMALLPRDKRKTMEGAVSAEMRQKDFDNYSTTDDHLMHITGMAEDEEGALYFIVKNSHGTLNPYGGYLYVSVPYFRLKTTSIMIHQESLPDDIGQRLR